MGVAVAKRNTLLLAIVLLLAAALWAAVAPPAAKAAPPSNAMNLGDLQGQLEGGSVQGYFLTVLGGATLADQTPVAIPATIESIVPGETQDGALILFAASGTAITDIGGIADGMSGSPLYVGDPAHPHPTIDPLIGAVSYGDIFTTDGLGLATPIDYMIAVQTNHPESKTAAAPAAHAESVSLAKPLTIASATVKRVVVAASAGEAKTVQATSGTAVFAPLDMIEIGGLSAQSNLYKQTAAKLEAAGYQVEPASVDSPAGDYDPSWSTPLVAGASLGTLYSTGDLWIGAAGTVTYVDGTTVMAYGHPLDWLGATTAYLTNAWVSGIWQTTLEPYKLMAPAATQGTITQDRNSGVEGVVGTLPAETSVSASATFAGKTATSSTQVPQAVVASPAFLNTYGDFLPTFAAQVPIYEALDAGQLAGSATTTSTVVVNDGTKDYTVTINNVWDDPSDVSYEVTGDIDNMLSTLTANSDGVAPATITSVAFSAALSAQHNETRIVSVRVPGGLKVGANDVIVSLAQYGVAALQTSHVTLTLPRGTTFGAGIEVYGAGNGGSYYSYGSPVSNSHTAAKPTGDDRQTVADLVTSLESAPTNNDILVDYLGGNNGNGSAPSIEGVGATASYVNGDLTLSADQMMLRALRPVVKRRSSVRLVGTIMNVDAPTTVSLYATRLGTATRKLVAVVPVSMNADGTGVFSDLQKNLKKSTRFTAIWDGDDTDLGATATTVVRVK